MEYIDEISGEITKKDLRTIGAVKTRYTPFQEGDVLFAKITPCMENGKCAIAKDLTNRIGFGSTEFHVVRPKSSIIAEWIYYNLRQQNVRDDAKGWMRGTAGQQRVPQIFLEELEIPLPPLPDQQRIAAILQKADRLRRLRRYARQLSDTYLQSVFLEMFGDVNANHFRWEIKEFAELIKGFEAGVNYLPIADGEVASDWRVLKISAVTWGEFNPSESKPISPNVKFNETIVVKRGDLLMSRANTTELVGAVSMVTHWPPKVLLPDKLWRVRFISKSKVWPEYVLYYLRQKSIRKIIGELATGSSGSMKNISMEKAKTLPVMVPPSHLQDEFVSKVNQFANIQRMQVESERQAEHLFQSLLERAFQGDLNL